MGILYILLGSAFGAIITYLRLQNTTPADNEELHNLKLRNRSLDLRIKSGEEKHQRFEAQLNSTKETLKLTMEAFDHRKNEIHKLDEELKTIKGLLEAPVDRSPSSELISKAETPIVNRDDEIEELEKQVKALLIEKSKLEIEKSSLEEEKSSLEEENLLIATRIENLEKELKVRTAECDELNHSLSKEQEDHQDALKQLQVQRTSIEALGKKFNADFENMAVKILKELESEQKTRR